MEKHKLVAICSSLLVLITIRIATISRRSWMFELYFSDFFQEEKIDFVRPSIEKSVSISAN